jgi:ketosteroid isomerase-like protein
MSKSTADAFGRDWVTAFNTRDLDRILDHYAPDVELISPAYLRFTGGRSDTLKGIEELRCYFGWALERYPELRFTLIEVAEGSGSVCVRYHTNLGDRIAVECFEGAPAQPVSRVLCHYTDLPG